jgi:translation initiation factor 2B subunit (eIF-2B alpha/beta/delta family)
MLIPTLLIEAIAIPLPEIAEGIHLTFKDIDQLKMMFLVYTVTLLWGVVKSGITWWKEKHDESEEKVQEFMEKTTEAIQRIEMKQQKIEDKQETIMTMIENVSDNKASFDDVRDITRKEIEYAKKLRS